MAISKEALQKLIQEIETQAVQAQRDIGAVKTAISTKQRDVRLLELTSEEVKSVPPETNVYEGVGRMFVLKPAQEVKQRLSVEVEELKTDIGNLNKKLDYLEKTHENSKNHITRILGPSQK